MARRISRKVLKQDEFVEAAAEVGSWLEENWQTAVRIAAALLVAVLLGFAWVAWSRNARAQAETRLADAMGAFLDLEAEGFRDEAALESVVDELQDVSSGAAGKVARFYEGVALYHLGRHDEAAARLEPLVESAPQETLKGAAHAVLAHVYQSDGRTEDAVALLNGLMEQDSARVPADETLLLIGQIYHAAGRADEAERSWQRVLDEYPTGSAASRARQLLDS